MALLEKTTNLTGSGDLNETGQYRDELTRSLWEQVDTGDLSEERMKSLGSTISKLVDYKMGERKPVTKMEPAGLVVPPLPGEEYSITEDDNISFTPIITKPSTVESPEEIETKETVKEVVEEVEDVNEEVINFASPVIPEPTAGKEKEVINPKETSAYTDVTGTPTPEQFGIDVEKLAGQDAFKDVYAITRENENSKTNPRGGWDKENEVWKPHESLEEGELDPTDPEGKRRLPALPTLAYGHKLTQDEFDSQTVHGIDISEGVTEEQALEIFEKDQFDFLKRTDVQLMDDRQKTIAFDYYHRIGPGVTKFNAWQNIIDSDYNMLWRNSGDINWNDGGQKTNYNTRNQKVFESLGVWDHITDADKRANLNLAKSKNVIEG